MKRLFIILALVATIMAPAAPTWAATNADLQHVFNDTPWFSFTDSAECVAPTETAAETPGSCALTGTGNPAKAFNYFHGCRKLSAAAAAGIIGNLMQESGVNPRSQQTVGGSARGIAQWEGARWDALLKAANKAGKPWYDFKFQLDFLWSEMGDQHAGPAQAPYLKNVPGLTRSQSTIEALRNLVKNPTQGAWAFELTFERAGTPVMENRIKNAISIFKKMGGTGDTGSDPAVGGEVTDSSDCTGDNDVSGGDGSTVIDKAHSLAWPKPACTQTFEGEKRSGCADPLAAYKAANVHKNGFDPYTDCGTFVATVMRKSGADPKYPVVGTGTQLAYVKDHPEKYTVISKPKTTGQLQPGDIMLYDGHTLIYSGEGSLPTVAASWHGHSPHRSSIGSAQDMLTKPGIVIARVKK